MLRPALALVALLLAGAPSLALVPSGWVTATLGSDGSVDVRETSADTASCIGFAPTTATCATGEGLFPIALTLGWPACDNGPVATSLSNCFVGDMLNVLAYQEPQQRQLVFKCTAIFLGPGIKLYDYACFSFGPWLFDVPFEHTCSMRAYGTTFAAGAPLGLPSDGTEGAAGSWLCAVTTIPGWG
ncbi:MAG TPA: hypothetical protein VGR28_06840 [Candidatus Thermoplasmatota archaeon]|jgi:hypothetical protein|nr:hypothetical protein [Candidatus Thermoplasmatota archaeon]